MPDICLGWSGDLQLDPTGDLLLVDGVDWASQSLARRLLTNPAVRDSNGNIIQPGDDPFNQDYGAGLGRDVDAIDDALTRKERINRIRAAISQEPLIDQNSPVQIQFFTDRNSQAQVVRIDFMTTTGEHGTVGVSI